MISLQDTIVFVKNIDMMKKEKNILIINRLIKAIKDFPTCYYNNIYKILQKKKKIVDLINEI